MHKADVIVVGAGAAGAVVAAELSNDSARKVILLEAGGLDWNPAFRVPVMTGVLAGSKYFTWIDQTEPEPFLANRAIRWPHGRVLGGSSAINGMVWMRGRPSDFDRWASTGLAGWNWDAVKRAYDRIENNSGDPNARGPIAVSRHTGDNPLYRTFVQAGVEAGYPEIDDFNRGSQEGIGRMSVNISNGRRQSSATAFLAAARGRRNLQVLPHAYVQRILLENKRAVGVSVVIKGRAAEIFADSVILCGGAVNSPHLLMLSGIGDANHLRHYGIVVRHDLPGVGCNLQDHACVRLAYECREPVSLHSFARADRAVIGVLKALIIGIGTAATTPFGAGFLLRSDTSETEPDLEGVFSPVLASTRLWIPLIRPPISGHGFGGTVYQLRPESRGSITLASADPRRRPHIVANYLSSPRDRRVVRQGVRTLRQIFCQRAFDRYRGKELFEMPSDEDESLDKAIAACADSAYHPVGSCKMGTSADPMAVVDATLRVHGLEGLHIADASVMPTITSGNTNAPSIMIGYRCAEFISGS